MILTAGPSYYRRIILNKYGHEIRQGTYDDYMDLCEDDLGPTISELIDGYISEWFFKDEMINHDCINPKVVNLIKALFHANIQTTMSGDMCGNDLVYIDLHRRYEQSLGRITLPPPWIIVIATVDRARMALGLPRSLIPHPMRGVYIVGDNWPRIRITRKGGMISVEEANEVVKAVLPILK